MLKHSDIAERLKEFGQSRFGTEYAWKKRFADALGITTQHLDRYLSAASEPGNKMYVRLVQLGCDIQWLLTGDQGEDRKRLTEREKQLLEELRRAGVDTVEKVRYLLSPEHLAADIAAAAVKEIQAKYRTKKSPGRKKK